MVALGQDGINTVVDTTPSPNWMNAPGRTHSGPVPAMLTMDLDGTAAAAATLNSMAAGVETQLADVFFLTDNYTMPHFTHSFDWGFTDIDYDVFGSIGAQQQPVQTDNTITTITIIDRDPEIARAIVAEEVDGQPDVKDLPNGSPAESPWVG